MGPHVLRPGELIMFGENVGMVFEAAVYDRMLPSSHQLASPRRLQAGSLMRSSRTASLRAADSCQPAEAYAPARRRRLSQVASGWLRLSAGGVVHCGCHSGYFIFAAPGDLEKTVVENVICSDTLKSTSDQILDAAGQISCDEWLRRLANP